MSPVISCPIDSMFLGHFKCGYISNSVKEVQTLPGWECPLLFLLKPDLQQHTDGAFDSTWFSLEDQEVKVKGCVFSKYEKCPGASRRWSEWGVARKIPEIPWGCLICLWGMLASAAWAPSCPTRSIHGFSCSVSCFFYSGAALFCAPLPPNQYHYHFRVPMTTHTLSESGGSRSKFLSSFLLKGPQRTYYFLQWHCLRAGCLRFRAQGFCWGDFIITKLIHRNPLHSNTLTMKNQKEKLRKQSHSPPQQIV